VTLGSCLVSNDIPFEGLAKDIIERRIQGQSWKQIADDFNLGSPGTARKMFTKLTGITDYKIKGNDLLKLAQGKGNPNVPDLDIPNITDTPKVPGKPVEQPSSKILEGWKANAQKQIDQLFASLGTKADFSSTDWTDIASINKFFDAHPDTMKKPDNLKFWVNEHPELLKEPPSPVIAAKEAAKKATSPDYTQKAPDYKWKLSKDELPPYDEIPAATRIDVVKRAKLNQGYAVIKSAHPELSLEQIDRAVARHWLLDQDTDPWKALQKKPNSITLQQTLSERVYTAIQKGISPTDLSNEWKIPKSLIDDIVQANGKWKLPLHHPLPEFVEDLELPDYQTTISNSNAASDVDIGDIPGGFGKGKGDVDTRSYPFATNAQLDAMRRRIPRSGVGEAEVTRYTGSGYSTINGALRGKSPMGSTLKRGIENMDKAMYQVDEAFSVTRGMGVSGFGMGHIDADIVKQLVGKVMQDKGFLSTSTKPIFGGGVRLNIEVPKGARGHWARPISHHTHEDEFILARGTRIMILGIDETSPGHFTVRGRVIV